MIRRLYIDNYKCFSNFELRLDKLPCSMIIGANGSGKSTIAEVLSCFSAIGRGNVNINDIIPQYARSALNTDRNSTMITLEIEIGDATRTWQYSLCVEPDGIAYRIVSEKLTLGETVLFDRARLHLSNTVVAMAVVSDETSESRHIADLRAMLAAIYVLRPVPQMMGASVATGTGFFLDADASNFASWLPNVMAHVNNAYSAFREYLQCVFPDFANVALVNTTVEGRTFTVGFKTGNADEFVSLGFDRLSDGEKCQFIAASLIALNAHVPNLTVFWDEPDNYITTSEVAYLLPALCNSFQKRGQLIVSSHSREAIVTFGENEIISFRRANHYSPVRQPQTAQEMRESGQFAGSLDEALQNGDAVS